VPLRVLAAVALPLIELAPLLPAAKFLKAIKGSLQHTIGRADTRRCALLILALGLQGCGVRSSQAKAYCRKQQHL
jgi:hypothetical protein